MPSGLSRSPAKSTVPVAFVASKTADGRRKAEKCHRLTSLPRASSARAAVRLANPSAVAALRGQRERDCPRRAARAKQQHVSHPTSIVCGHAASQSVRRKAFAIGAVRRAELPPSVDNRIDCADAPPPRRSKVSRVGQDKPLSCGTVTFTPTRFPARASPLTACSNRRPAQPQTARTPSPDRARQRAALCMAGERECPTGKAPHAHHARLVRPVIAVTSFLPAQRTVPRASRNARPMPACMQQCCVGSAFLHGGRARVGHGSEGAPPPSAPPLPPPSAPQATNCGRAGGE